MYARFFRNPAEYVAEQVNIVKQRCSQHRAKTPDDTFTDERRSCNCKSLCKDLKTARRALKRAARIVFQRPTIGHTIDGADAIPVPEKLRITPHEETPAPPSYSEDDEDARIWGPIRKIPNERYVKLALKYGPLYVETIDGEILPTEAEVTGHARGGNNRVTFVEYNNGTKIVIRVPACGWNPAWLAIDAEAMVNQVKVMKYLKRKTGIPIPEVINYDTTIDDNILGAPYVMMECLPGEAVCWAWWENNDILPLEQKRQNIMRSLAKTMVKLHNLKFDAIGGLHFQDDDDGTKGEPWVDDFINIYSGMGPRDEEFLQTPEEERRVPEFDTSQEFMRLQLEGWRDDELEKWPGPFDRDVRERAQINGKYALYSILIDYMPFSELTTDVGDLEYFVIAPPDFDWQNVLVDEHGNVTGLIDWDVVKTTPRFTGWAALPNWLKQDWYEDYIWPSWGPINTMHTDELALCRHDYATYMKVACRAAGRDEDGEEVDDHKFTWRSHFYARIMDTIGEDGMDDMLHRLLDLFCPRTNKYAFIGNIGKKGFAPGQEEFLRNNLSKILAG